MFSDFNNSELERISNILADTDTGFSGTELRRLLEVCKIPDIESNAAKRVRLFNAFANWCKTLGNSDCVYHFIVEAMMPARWLDKPHEKSVMQGALNEVLALKGIQLNDKNEYVSIQPATTVSEAKQRASKLRKELVDIQAHHRVLRCCTEELLARDYFHAVHEAAKSLTDRISEETGLSLDGTPLIERAFSSQSPAVIISALRTASEKNEYRGIKDMFLGVNFAVRNVTAHELRIKWDIDEGKALNMLVIISALHKILDDCQFARVNV